MDRHSDIVSDDNSSAARHGNTRLLVTHDGQLDKALLRRTEGYMHKKGGAVNARGGFRNWKKRWFVIAEVEVLGAQGYELQYYDAPHGNLKGKVGLSEIEIQCEAKSQHKKVKYEFQIVLQNGGTLELSCDDANERDEWVETLNMITAYLRKILTTQAMTLDGYDPFDEDDEESFNIGEEIAQNCQAFGPGLFGAEAGVQSQFVIQVTLRKESFILSSSTTTSSFSNTNMHCFIQVHDLMGQQVTRGGMPITATLSNSECLYYIRVIDNDDGTYFCQYVLGRAGQYHLTIRLNDEHDIFGSPFNVEILPSRTMARFCVAEGEALHSIVANETQTFTITAMDGFGNKKNNGGDPFEVGVMGPAQLKALSDNNDGTYTCTIAAHSPAAASYVTSSSLMVIITLHGKAIQGSPFKPIITEDLRSLYAGGSVKNAHQSNASRASIASASGAASIASASTRNTSQVTGMSKHVMAQQAPPPPNAFGNDDNQGDTDGAMDLADLDNGNADDDQSSVGHRSQSPKGPPSVQGSVRSSATGRNNNNNNNASSAASVASNRAHTPPPTAGNNNTSSSGTKTAQRVPSISSNAPANTATAAPKPSASAAALTAMAATGNSGTGMGGGLSRLERSRQRALLAKALSESANAPNGNNNSTSPLQAGEADMGISPLTGQQDPSGRKLTKLEELQRNMTSSTGNASASASGHNGGQRNEAFFNPPQPPQPQHVSFFCYYVTTSTLSIIHNLKYFMSFLLILIILSDVLHISSLNFLQRPGAPRPVSNEFLSQVVAALQQGLGGGSVLGEFTLRCFVCFCRTDRLVC